MDGRFRARMVPSLARTPTHFLESAFSEECTYLKESKEGKKQRVLIHLSGKKTETVVLFFSLQMFFWIVFLIIVYILCSIYCVYGCIQVLELAIVYTIYK
ncbi:hypothetical protein ABFS83_08G115000 [Erythranthe nasuta]